MAPMKSINMPPPPDDGDDLASPSISSTRLRNSHCTDRAVPSMDRFGQDREKGERPDLLGSPAGE